MDTQQYVGVATGLVYHHTPPFLDHHARSFPVSNQPMAWHPNHGQASPPNSAASSSSSLYSAMSHVDERVDYPSDATSPFVPRHASNSFVGHHQSPTLDPGSSDPAMAFGSPQIESSIGPSRILTRRRARAAAQGHDQEPTNPSGQTYDRRQHSLAFAVQQMSRPQTPSGELSGPPLQVHDHVGLGPLGHSAAPMAPYAFMPSHSRSTSGSASSSQPRSASPALSVSSAMTSLSSSTSAARSRPYPAFPPLPQESEVEDMPSRPKHRKQRLWSTDRKKICVYHRDNPNMKQEAIAALFGVERSTVSKILKDKDRWLNVRDDEKMQISKLRPSKFPTIEDKLVTWLVECTRDKILLTDALIRSKAKEVAHEMQIYEDRFKASSGWVENFKARHGIKKGVYHGNGLNEQKAIANGCGFIPSGTRRTYITPAAMASQVERPADSRPEEAEPESEDEGRQLQHSSTAQSEWDASAPPAGVYDYSAQPEPVPMADPATLSLPPAEGAPMEQTYLVPPVAQYNESEEILSIPEAEEMASKLLSFFQEEPQSRWISTELADALHEIRTRLYDRVSGSLRSS